MTHETCGPARRPSFYLISFNRGGGRSGLGPLDPLLIQQCLTATLWVSRGIQGHFDIDNSLSQNVMIPDLKGGYFMLIKCAGVICMGPPIPADT